MAGAEERALPREEEITAEITAAALEPVFAEADGIALFLLGRGNVP